MLKRAARLLLGDYAIYRIFKHAWPDPAAPGNESAVPDEPPVSRVTLLDDVNELASSVHEDLRPLAACTGHEAHLFGIWTDGVLAGAAAYWWGRRYAARGFWPLEPGEAKLVQFSIAAALRGRGLAPPLVAESAALMHALGFSPLYARVWHNHHASRRAFERAGWRNVAIVVEADPFRTGRPARWTIPVRTAQYRAFPAEPARDSA